MAKQEKPDFFSCDCSDGHYYISVTGGMKGRAQNLADVEKETDVTDSRSESQSREDSQFGKLAEIVAYELLSEMGASVKYNHDGWEYDLLVNGKKADVKARDYTQTSSRYADLLIRDRKDTNHSPDDVDIIIQVMLNGKRSNKGYVTGYCTGREGAAASIFQKAKTHRTRNFPHNKLHSIDKLI